ncbi:unnamed protein product [Cuscuta campestris]|uniref:Retrotransposon gag domain-containing protein n=1 Tax=Cuscuta campestris TaxID=132261 RepID=A0A484MQD9_9ASTE|nr:unnamed protein product [Cuscuta campestris]
MRPQAQAWAPDEPFQGAFTPFPSSLAQFAADPTNAQALQGYHQVMAMMQQAGGFMSFSYPGMFPSVVSHVPPLVSTPSTFIPRVVPVRLVNLTGAMDKAAPSNVQGNSKEANDAEQEEARRRKGKGVGVYRLSYDEDDLDKTESVARKRRALEEKVEEKAGVKKRTLAKSPFSARVHAHRLGRKIKLDVEKFTRKEDPDIHLDTFHNAAQMVGCTDAEECLLFFSSLRGRPVEWFNNLPHGKIRFFERLAEIFHKKYRENCIKRKKFTYLNTVGKREKESLTQFLTRWRDEVDKVEEMDDKTAMSLLMNAFRSGDFYTEFCTRPASSYQEAYNITWEYAEAENLNRIKRELKEGYTKAKSEKARKDDQAGGSRPKVTNDGIVHQIRDKKGDQPNRGLRKTHRRVLESTHMNRIKERREDGQNVVKITKLALDGSVLMSRTWTVAWADSKKRKKTLEIGALMLRYRLETGWIRKRIHIHTYMDPYRLFGREGLEKMPKEKKNNITVLYEPSFVDRNV